MKIQTQRIKIYEMQQRKFREKSLQLLTHTLRKKKHLNLLPNITPQNLENEQIKPKVNRTKEIVKTKAEINGTENRKD